MSRFALALYCDDVRQEVGGKVSFIGVYREKMFIPALPTVIPKFCIGIWARTSSDKPFQSIKVRLFANDKKLLEQELPNTIDEAESAAPAPPLPGDTFNLRYQTAHIVIQISPFQVTEPTIIRVRIQADDEELRAGGLSIEPLPQPAEQLSKTA